MRDIQTDLRDRGATGVKTSPAVIETSNPYLPVELLDHIVDFLHDTKDALENCCLVSKSWIPRSRKRLFAEVEFRTAEKLRSWKNTFSDPSTSPACYTKTLFVGCPEAVRAADTKEGGWIPTFSGVVHLEVDLHLMCHEPGACLVSLYGLSPTLKSLRVTATYMPSQVLDLVYSFPLLDDLSVVIHNMFNDDGHHEELNVAQPPCPPPFTGSLQLFVQTGLNPIVAQLLSLPSGLSFRKLDFSGYPENDFSLATALVERCCDTLESVDCHSTRDQSDSIDLSKAIKLVDIAFGCDTNPQWIVKTLRTITRNHRNLQEISITTSYVVHGPGVNNPGPPDPASLLEKSVYDEWSELDRLLAQLWESHSIRAKVGYCVPRSVRGARARVCMEKLLPHVTGKGMISLVEQKCRW